MNLVLYRLDITMHDYLLFATTERGRVAETGPFVHNYALTYAFGWARSPWHHEGHKPHYQQELARVGKRYITPARLLRGSTVVTQYNTMHERYYLEPAQKSVGYPDWGFIKCYRPGSLFRGYVVSAAAQSFPRFIRLGKFLAKAAVQVTEATSLTRQETVLTGQRDQRLIAPGPLLNWDDLASPSRPVIYDLVSRALPTSLIDNPVFEGIPGPYLLAKFADEQRELVLPLQMGYYGGNLCASW